MQRYPPHSDSLTHIITAILNRLDLNQFQVFYNYFKWGLESYDP